jgi:type IV pilus assembly protein PilY1
VYFGTGRFLGQKDLGTNGQQTFYGVMEPIDLNGDFTWGQVSLSDLQDVTDVEVGVDGILTTTTGLSPIPADSNANGEVDFEDLKVDIQDHRSGWFRDLVIGISGGSSAKSFTAPEILRSLVFFTDFTPKGNQCAPGGESNLFVVHFATGTATDFGALGSSNGTTNNVLAELGAGQASAPALFIGGDQQDTGRAMVQQSGGNLTSTEVRFAPLGGVVNSVPRRISWRELDIN